MIIAIFCIVGGSFIIIFNIIIYPKFNSLIYSVIGLFAIVVILLIIAAHVYVKYKNFSDYSSLEDDSDDTLDKDCGCEDAEETDDIPKH